MDLHRICFVSSENVLLMVQGIHEQSEHHTRLLQSALELKRPVRRHQVMDDGVVDLGSRLCSLLFGNSMYKNEDPRKMES